MNESNQKVDKQRFQTGTIHKQGEVKGGVITKEKISASHIDVTNSTRGGGFIFEFYLIGIL